MKCLLEYRISVGIRVYESNKVTGHLPRSPEENFLHWCLTRSRDLQRAWGADQGTPAAAELFCSISFFPLLLSPDPFLEVEENTFSEALELSGTPFPYFPEMMPQASGDHVIAPTPTEEKTLKSYFCKLGSKVSGCLERTWLVVGKTGQICELISA